MGGEVRCSLFVRECIPDLHVRLPARNSLRLASIYFQFAHSSFDVRLLA